LRSLERVLILFFLLFLLAVSGAIAGGDGQDIQPMPTILAEMQDLWQRYQKAADEGLQEQCSEICERIVTLRKKAGMLDCGRFARAFAIRAWHSQQSGSSASAVREFRTAVELAPSAREYRVGLAGAIAKRSPVNVTSYVPEYWEAAVSGFSSIRGRYLMQADAALWVGVMLLVAGGAWIAAMLFRYWRPFFHTIMELVAKPFADEIATPLTAVILAIPLFFGAPLEWIILAFFAVTWAFQRRGERMLSLLTLVVCWFGAGMIMLSSQMAGGITTTEMRAAFAADRQDVEENVVLEIERRLLREGVVDTDGNIQPPDDNDSETRTQLFLYAVGLRKLGRTQGVGGVDLLSLFDALRGDDYISLQSMVIASNIRFERGNHTRAEEGYRRVLDEDPSNVFALYNWWSLSEAKDLKNSFSLWNRLLDEHKDFLKRFDIRYGAEQQPLEEDQQRPDLIDANLARSDISKLVRKGLAVANGTEASEVEPLDLLAGNLSGPHNLWIPIVFAAMLAAHFALKKVGMASSCRSCGKVFCKHCDLEPTASSRCQACNSVLTLSSPIDAELGRSQKQRIKRHEKYFRVKTLVYNIIAPGLGNTLAGRPMVGAGLLLLWSCFVSLVYFTVGAPRTESMPFFSHWTFFLGLAALLLAAASYSLAVWTVMKEK
jgi:hypothetical protein